MSAYVSDERVEGRHCPRCGGPLYWIHDSRIAPSLGEVVDGRSSVRLVDDVRRTRADREVTVQTGGSRYSATVRTRYERLVEWVCPACNLAMARGQAAAGDPEAGDGQTRMETVAAEAAGGRKRDGV